VITLNPTTADPTIPLSDDEVETVNVSPQLVKKWAAIAGRWRFSGTNAEYEGPDNPGMTNPLGLARASLRFRDGVLRTRIKLSRTEKTTGGLFFGFHSMDSPYLMAQLGAFDRAYVISEHRPEIGWFQLASAGRLSNLSTEFEYDLQVSVTGQSVRFTVDDVDILSTVVSSPIEGTGFGLYAWGEGSITFTETTVESSVPKVFVIMPFSEPFGPLYRDVILPVARKLGFEVVRVDEVVGPGLIISDIQRQIESSHAVVAEVSTPNPNVFYELGYADALRKPAVLLVREQEGQAMPFDIRGSRAIFYDDSIGGKKHVERKLRQHLKAVLGE
jgi:hypothetical protein